MKENNISTYIPDNSRPQYQDENALCFAFYDNKILLRNGGLAAGIPTLTELKNNKIEFSAEHYVGTLSGKQCYGVELFSDHYQDYEFRPLRSLLIELDQDMFLMSGRAYQIVNWGVMNRFCGKCGAKTEIQEQERVIVCPSCKSSFYPRISPAIIVAILKDDQILLAHNNNFKNKLYSLIAGFAEPGETFEACVKREVKEEVGIKIKNIKYYGSQPWPFPDSLMIGFIAEYDSGEITVDGIEIGDAGWYSRGNMPEIPLSHSIAGKIIRAYLDNSY